MPTTVEILQLCTDLAKRMKVFQKTAKQALERKGEIDPDPRAFWEAIDEEVLRRYDAMMEEISGAPRLFSAEELDSLSTLS